MSEPTIQIYGRLDPEEKQSLCRELSDAFAKIPDRTWPSGPDFLAFRNEFPENLDSATRCSCSARVCVLSDDVEISRSFRFYVKLMGESPQIPVVFAGIRQARLVQRLHVAGTAWTIRERDDWKRLALTVRRAVETSWWWVISSVEIPVVLVDHDGRVVEANRASRRRFGERVIGRSYAQAIEGRDGASELPKGHPIRKALGLDVVSSDSRPAFRGISRYIDVTSGEEVIRRAELLCFPVTNLGGTITSVAVIYFDLSYFDRINEASRAFALSNDVDSLGEEIVRQVEAMGYRRARLYRYDPDQGILIGRAAVGFESEANRNSFLTRTLSIEQDVESRNTISHQVPSLFVYGDRPETEPELDLVRYGCLRGSDEQVLEKERVSRWVDLPMLVPAADDEGHSRTASWGKLSVDDAENSDRLTARDVADLSALAAMASGSLAEKLRPKPDSIILDVYERYARELDTAEWRKPRIQISTKVRTLLLKLYQEVFGLELALYREFRPRSRELHLKEWVAREGVLPNDCSIIPILPVEGYPTYEIFDKTHVDDEGNVLPGERVLPVAMNRAEGVIDAVLKLRNWTEAEQRYLRWVQSEILIPVQSENNIRGAIVGLSPRRDALDEERVDVSNVLRRFANTAQLWLQLGELHDSRASALRMLDCLKAWHELQKEPEGPAFYAGLAALLTAGCGLGWHRALIFRTRHDAPHVARLEYGIGGLGDPAHATVQSLVEESENDLLTLVRKRLADPEPKGYHPNLGDLTTDPFYDRYIKGRESAVELALSVVSEGSPLRRILEHESPDRPSHTTLGAEDEPIRSWNADFERLFPAPTTHIFPLYSLDPDSSRLLGFIALDNCYRPSLHDYSPSLHEDTVRPLTLAMVQLVRDLIDARQQYRLFSGMLGALPPIRHGPEIKTEWDKFGDSFSELLDAVEQPGVGIAPELIANVKQARVALNSRIDAMAEAVMAIENWRNPTHTYEPVCDLKAYLLRLVEDWKDCAEFKLKIDLPSKCSLPRCDRLILENTMKCLLENARSVSTTGHGTRFRVKLTARTLGNIHPFEQVALITLRDYGPGIPPWKVPFLFMDGFTDRRDVREVVSIDGQKPQHKGLGLGMARAFLLRAHGELRLEDPGWPGRGATFGVYLGTSKPASSGRKR
jgi:hypothetical protein